MIIKKCIERVLMIFVFFSFLQCDKVLDKTDLGNITEDAVWNDAALVEATVNRIYQRINPGWPTGSDGLSDNAPGRNSTMYGELNDNSNGSYGTFYSILRDINISLEGMALELIEGDALAPLKGQALFLRAYTLWRLVDIYGGVPIITQTFSPEDELELPRNATSECIAQILADIDAATEDLPDTYDANGFGRITKGAALAFKGRVLLHYASERFDPNQLATDRWQNAYNALTIAKSNLDANGKGLHSSYADLWFDDSNGNPEIVWTRLYNSDQTHSRDAQVRPFQPGFGGGRTDNPTIDLLETYPLKDGKKIDDITSAYTYDPVTFWRNRDPRFEITIAWNGDIWPVTIQEPFKTSDVFWTFRDNTTNIEGDASVTFTGTHTRKAVDPSLDSDEARISTTQWIEMRYAELILNLAEAANEIGNGDEALNILYSIRQRAGIENNDGRYGLDVGLENDQDAMRDAILLERRLEFAFEGVRAQDLKRRRLYASLLNGTERMGFFITKTSAFDALAPSESLLEDRVALEKLVLGGTVDLNNPADYQTYFKTETYSVERNSDEPGQDGVDINFLDKYYFLDIPASILGRNPELEQTAGWPGGTFDPLQ